MSLHRKSKKIVISAPFRFEHRIHVGFDPATGQYHGLPKQWRAIIGAPQNLSHRPKPVTDPSSFKPIELEAMKTVVRGESRCSKEYLDHNVYSRGNSLLRPVGSSAACASNPRPTFQFNNSYLKAQESSNVSRHNTLNTPKAVETQLPSASTFPKLQQNTEKTPEVTAYNSSGNVRKNDESINKKRLTDEQFRCILKMVVSPENPCDDLENFFQIGLGSTGVVVVANQKSTGQKVAIKKMNIYEQQRREMLFNEIMIMKDYKHPNIVGIYGSYLVVNELWVIMEYMEGGVLTDIITQLRIDEIVIATISIQCLRALDYLHSNNVIHRDVKSDSILLSKNGIVKLSDFGFCGQLSIEVPRRKSFVGTPYWMSPEIISRLPYGTETDIWSMGIMVIEMIQGEPPLFDVKPIEAMRTIRDMPPPELNEPNKVSLELNSFLSLMLVRDHSLRATAKQLLGHVFMSKASHPSIICTLINFCKSRQMHFHSGQT